MNIPDANLPSFTDESFPEEQYLPDLRGVARLLDICPLPDAQGIADVVSLYKTKFKRDITEEEAAAILRRTIRFLWAINLPADYAGEETTIR